MAQDKLISPAALKSAISADSNSYFLVDIRSYAAYSGGYIVGSVNIPSGKQFDLRVNEIPTGTAVVLISNASYNGIAKALSTLQEAGYNISLVYVLEGGIDAWAGAGLPTENLEVWAC